MAFLTASEDFCVFRHLACLRFSVDIPSLIEHSPSFSMTVEQRNQKVESLNRSGLFSLMHSG